MQFDHINIRAKNLDETVAFYRDIIGLEVGPRPSFTFPGAWLYHEGRAVIHLTVAAGPLAAADEGPIDHFAFRAEDLSGVISRLEGKNLPFSVRDIPDGGGRQCFLHDPNGIRVEINGR